VSAPAASWGSQLKNTAALDKDALIVMSVIALFVVYAAQAL
jgi:hypothetical protein